MGRTAYWQRHLHLLGAFALAPAFAGIYFLAFWLRFESPMSEREWDVFQATAAWVVLVKLAWFAGLRACQGWTRPVVFDDLKVLFKAAGGGLASMIAIQYLLRPMPAVPRGVLLIDWSTTIIVLGGARALARGAREARWSLLTPADQVRVLIAGTGEMGAMLPQLIRRSLGNRYRVLGYIACAAKQVGGRIAGLPVLADCQRAMSVARTLRVGQILAAQGELDGRLLRRMMDDARRFGCEVRVVPNCRQLIESGVAVQPRPVSIEDLLQREPVRLDIENIRQWIDGRSIMVTGSAGSIGSEICRQILNFNPRRLVLLDRSETAQFFLERELRTLAGENQLHLCLADVLDQQRMRRVMTRHRPEVILHAAAYKHVPLLEDHPQEAVRNIVTATRLLADLAAEHGADSLVMISTDKAVNPTSVMGACKRVAEMYVQSLAGRTETRFVTVRFGNVLDSAGSVVQLFRQQIAAGGPVTVTHPEMRRFFMTIPEAARLVIQAGAIGQSGQILVLDMGEPVRIVDLAADMIRLSGLRVGEDVEIKFCGLRPGEKLFEELHVPGERLLPTSHPKIIVADRKPPRVADLRAAIAELEQTAGGAPEQIAAQLEQIVCGYCPTRRTESRLRVAA
jgi:FlaA1/EpsC-like NDP-sugar epimerase